MKLIRKALWPTAIVAAFLMLFGALGSAVNADTVTGNVKTADGGSVVYVEIDVDNLVADAEAALDKARAALDTAEDAEVIANALVDDSLSSPRRAAAAEVRAAVVEVRAAAKDVDASNAAIKATAAPLSTAESTYMMAIGTGTIGVTVAAPTTTVIEAAATGVVAAANAVVRAANHGLSDADATVENPMPVSGVDFAEGQDFDTSLDDYTVEIDDGTGSASIVATLEDVDGDAEVDSNRATDSRTVTPVLVNSKADREELEDYDVTETGSAYYVLVVVECTEFGSYDISFTNTHGPGARDDVVEAEAELECGTTVDSAVLSASAPTIFTTTDKLTSKITVTLEDKDGDGAAPGDAVRFKTDNCEFTNGKSADSDESVTVKGVTTAVVTLDCSEKSAKVGTATVSASVDRASDSDVYAEALVVTLVGPVMDLTLLSPSMDNMVCGSPRQIDITAVDINGEAVADGTEVIVSTNFGGVLTGASTGRFAPSSTVVETKDGAATVYLITSDTQVGDYAVVALAESGVAKLTVACGMEMGMGADADADAPAITPPSTGNAGLAETSGSSWMLLAIAGVLASVMVAVGKGIPSFFRR